MSNSSNNTPRDADDWPPHRDVQPVPADPTERRRLVELALYHPAWDSDTTGVDCIDYEFVYVNPLTEMIDDDPVLNTAFRVWIEAGPPHDRSDCEPPPEGGWTDANKWLGGVDLRLNCGAPDAETALVKLGRMMEFFYPLDPRRTDVGDPATPEERAAWELSPWSCTWRDIADDDAQRCEADADGWCVHCGFHTKDAGDGGEE